MLVGEGTESVGTEMDEGLHVLLCESAGGCTSSVSDRDWRGDKKIVSKSDSPTLPW